MSGQASADPTTTNRIRNILATVPDSKAKAAPGVWASGVNYLGLYPPEDGLLGFVQAEDPGAVHLAAAPPNSKSLYSGLAPTFLHEAEHTRQLGNRDRLDKIAGNTLWDNPFIVGNFSTQQRVKPIMEQYRNQLGFGSNWRSDLELPANLVSYEARLPVGTAITDTPFGKQFFNADQKLQDWYFANSLPNQPSIWNNMPAQTMPDNRKPPLMQLGDFVDWIKRGFK